MEQEALSRAQSGFSMANFVPVIREFVSRGIPMAEIEPKVNVLTYHAWRALGRQVRKGEHGVKVSVCLKREPKEGEPDPNDGRLLFTSATVFHVSQTDEIASARPLGDGTAAYLAAQAVSA